MNDFDRLIGEWQGSGDFPSDPPLHMSAEVTIERLGELIVWRSTGHPAELPSSMSVIGGAPEGEPQPMHYFDSRGVKRLLLTAIDGSTWRIWRAPGEDWNGPDGPGFNQRFSGEISLDGRTIEGRWERGYGPAGDEWQLDFPFTYVRRSTDLALFAGIAVADFAAALGWYEKLFGAAPASFPTGTEAVWQLAGQRLAYVVERPEHAGHSLNTIIVDDLGAGAAGIADRGLEPWKDETYDNGVRKLTYRDPDGNEFGLGGLPE